MGNTQRNLCLAVDTVGDRLRRVPPIVTQLSTYATDSGGDSGRGAAYVGGAHTHLLVVVAHDVLVVGVRVLGEEPLDKVARLLRREAENHVQLVHVAAVEERRKPPGILSQELL
jgi:hypothetical protein